MSIRLLWELLKKKSDVIVKFKGGKKVIVPMYVTINIYIEEELSERRPYKDWVNPWVTYKGIDMADGKILKIERKSLKGGSFVTSFLNDIFQSYYNFSIFTSEFSNNYYQIKSDANLGIDNDNTYTFNLNSGEILTVNVLYS